MATSDHPFKLIHADPRMVEDVLRGFVAPDWADRLDFSTLAPLDKEHIGPALHRRIGDKAWRVERRDGAPLADGRRPHVNVPLEFQSETDLDMAWRTHEYLYPPFLVRQFLHCIRNIPLFFFTMRSTPPSVPHMPISKRRRDIVWASASSGSCIRLRG